jgi:hypothetical protein
MQTQEAIEAGGAWLCQAIQTALQEGKGLAVGKLGTSELALLNAHALTPYVVHNATFNAGLWPQTQLTSWVTHMQTEVLPHMDGMVEWNSQSAEKIVLDKYAPNSHRLVLRSLEPYYQTDPDKQWTHVLPDHIAVISPFADSIQTQVRKGLRSVWDKQPTLWTHEPRVSVIRTGCSPFLDDIGPAAWPRAVLEKGWQEAVSMCVKQTLETGARVILVGCGALSLPIVVALKQVGIVAIHLGGATQILFGVRGKRWNTHSVISTLYGPQWISPSSEETPRNANLIEGGCYW